MKKLALLILVISVLGFTPQSLSQKVRTALMAADGSDNPANASEQLTINELEHGLVADGQIELVDRRLINQTMKEQNFQLTDRLDPSSATKYGHLLGVPLLVFVRLDGNQSSMKSIPKFGYFQWTGTVFFQMTALVIDVETGTILAAPTSKFDKTNVALKTTLAQRLPVNGQPGPGPTEALDELNKQAFQSVTGELTPELVALLKKLAPAAEKKTLQVAGVRAGKTYLNGGTADSIKPGDRFQIFRMSDNGLKDPRTNKAILERTDVCVLTIATVQQPELSSGECHGQLAQLGDDATSITDP